MSIGPTKNNLNKKNLILSVKSFELNMQAESVMGFMIREINYILSILPK